MTVEKLIEELQKMPPETDVVLVWADMAEGGNVEFTPTHVILSQPKGRVEVFNIDCIY